MIQNQSVFEVLSAQAEQTPDAFALLAPDRKPLSFRSLKLHIEKIAHCLNANGIFRNDRVAVVLPNGPEMASAFLSVAACASCAPLNPNYRKKEFEFYLSDLNAKALLLDKGIESPAREAALAEGIPVFEISISPENEAGLFYLPGGEKDMESKTDFSGEDDEALVLHTSGTTSHPKIVPLTQRNICASAENIKSTLKLTGRDCCLNVMPLFHIHGLIAAVLSSVGAGASVVCTPGFEVDSFFRWLLSFNASWYTAVPTMHQTILSKIQAGRDVDEIAALRFIRSSSAALNPQLMKGLEEAFNVPVIESYGMTEAAHQMTSNPLPPLERKSGTVGIAAGPKVRILDQAGNFLAPGETGEIVIQGDNVTLGYENNPLANEVAFTAGWFRTGDEGRVDGDGYLTITGRLKEMINRGGEKIAPREVDEALLKHPDVGVAVAFSVPHPTLGEDLAAAVVLKAGSECTEMQLRAFAFSELADFKVPSRIVIVDEIPKGPTGKLQRIGLAEKLKTVLQTDFVPPVKEIEFALVGIWKELLGRDTIGIQDNFFALGGDSLSAASVIREVEAFTGRKLDLPILFQSPTIEQMANRLQDPGIDSDSYLVPVRPAGSKKPLFLVPGHGGDIFSFVLLTKYLNPDRPVYVFRFPEAARRDNDVADSMIEEIAARYVEEIMALQPEGPYFLGGFCYGGLPVFEMAQRLRAQGKETGLVALIYANIPNSSLKISLKERIAFHGKKVLTGSLKDKLVYLKSTMRNIMERISRRLMPSVTFRFIPPDPGRYFNPRYFPGRITLFDPTNQYGEKYHDPHMGWKGLASEIEIHAVSGNRRTILQEPDVQDLAEKLNSCLDDSPR